MMVSTKPFPLLLFTAAITAIPIAGNEHRGVGHNGNINNSIVKCKNPEQKLFCCNDAKSSEAAGTFSGILDDSFVKCDALTIDGWDVGDIVGRNRCKAKTACCHSGSDQTGHFDIVTGCAAFAGASRA